MTELPLPCGPMKPMVSAGGNVGSPAAIDYLKRAFGRRFGGLWAGISKEGARLFVGVVGAGADDRETAKSAPDVGGAVVVVDVRYTDRELDAWKDQLVEEVMLPRVGTEAPHLTGVGRGMRGNVCSEHGLPVVMVMVSECDRWLLEEIAARIPADAVDVVIGAGARRLGPRPPTPG